MLFLVQVEFNPTRVKRYRLIGYANRRLAAEDFRDDKKDAGDMGAGHSVTVLYEVVPQDQQPSNAVAPLRYQSRKTTTSRSHELMTLRVRYKTPEGAVSKLKESVLVDHTTPLLKTSNAFRFSAAVAQFGMLLRGSEHKGSSAYHKVIASAEGALGRDLKGYRKGFIQLVRKAKEIASRQSRRD